MPICSPLSDRVRRAVIGATVGACLSVIAAGCSSSSGARGESAAPAPAPAGSVGTDEADVNAINPIGPFFEHRLDYALTDSQVPKLAAVDSRYLADARPLRRVLDSLRTQAHEFNGYVPNAPKKPDTASARQPSRDSVQRLHDAVAGVSAQLRARARRARAEALDVLTLEQLERVAQLGTGAGGYTTMPVSNRRGGGGVGGGGNMQSNQPGNTTTRLVVNATPTIRSPLRGIVLSDSQRVTIDSIRAAFRGQARDLGDPGRALVAPLRDLIRRQYDAIREVLTPDQQATFDKNRAPGGATTTTPPASSAPAAKN